MSAVSLSDAFATYDCKVPGCDGEARVNRGPFAYLCDYHRAERGPHNGNSPEKAREVGRMGGAARAAVLREAEEVGFERKARELVKVGARLDKAIVKFRPVKGELEEAMREWKAALVRAATNGDEE